MRSFHRNPFRSIGLYFGYPTCCIKYFVQNILCYGPNASSTKKSPSRVQRRVSKNTGFIPCSYCTWKILSKQTTLSGLITKRISPNAFPTAAPEYKTNGKV